MCNDRPKQSNPAKTGVFHRFDGAVVFWDERMSTQAVPRPLLDADASRARRAELVDKMAASYILQGALDRLRRL